VVVVDNGSDDGAEEVVWAELQRLCPGAVRIAHDSLGSAAGPATTGPTGANDAVPAGANGAVPEGVLITCPRNRGWSGGMNLGLAYIRATRPGDYFLLLNNDVLIEPGVLEALVERCETDPTIGLCGPTQRLHDEHGRLSATLPCGIRYQPFVGFSARIDLIPGDEADPTRVEKRMYAIRGGAVLGTAAYLRATGLLNTESFIYYEEEDIAHTARRAGFRIAWAPAAKVSNIHDATMQTNGITSREREPMVRYLMARARFRFTARHYPWFLATVLAAQLVHCAYDLVRGNIPEMWAALLGAYDGVRSQHRRFAALGQAELPGKVIERRGSLDHRRRRAAARARRLATAPSAPGSLRPGAGNGAPAGSGGSPLRPVNTGRAWSLRADRARPEAPSR
jgi:GT2 family glycosyltransferase